MEGKKTMNAYLFVHFKEKRTPDGEQVYFAVSKDGFHWEKVNEGNPVLWSYRGDKGVRDCTITRTKEGEFVILGTDLSLAYEMPGRYENSWEKVSRYGSKCLTLWRSRDLVTWSEQEMMELGDENFGCLWAPDVIYDREMGDYIVHWSSSHSCNQFGAKAIYYSRTRDFRTFSAPRELYRRGDGGGVIDSAMYEEEGRYYLFLKSEGNPHRIILLEGDSANGPFERVEAFDKSMETLEPGLYEAPTAFQTADGRWCLMLDYYGCSAEGQGYVPFLADSLKEGNFRRSDGEFEFPYGFKHGTVTRITQEEYDRLKAFRKSPSQS